MRRHIVFPSSGLAALITGLLFGIPLLVEAQNYTISSPAFDGGGGVSTGGLYSVSGTVRKPDAAPMSGGSYGLAGGFSSVVTVIQTPDAPRLFVAQTNGNVTVSWAKPSAGWVLEFTPTTPTPLPWTTIMPATYQSNATQYFITVPSPTGRRFYRLHRQ